MIAALGVLAPTLTDLFMEGTMFDAQRRDEPRRPNRRDSLYQPPRENGRVRGSHDGHVARTSMYTKASLNPGRTALALAAVGALGAALAAGARRRSELDVEVELEPRGDNLPYTGLRDDTMLRKDEPVRHASDRLSDRSFRADDGIRAGDYGFRGDADEAH